MKKIILTSLLACIASYSFAGPFGPQPPQMSPELQACNQYFGTWMDCQPGWVNHSQVEMCRKVDQQWSEMRCQQLGREYHAEMLKFNRVYQEWVAQQQQAQERWCKEVNRTPCPPWQPMP